MKKYLEIAHIIFFLILFLVALHSKKTSQFHPKKFFKLFELIFYYEVKN
jgi:hypothetical protein